MVSNTLMIYVVMLSWGVRKVLLDLIRDVPVTRLSSLVAYCYIY